MFQAIGAFFNMFFTLFQAGNTAAESIHDLAKIGKSKTGHMVKVEEINNTKAIELLNKELALITHNPTTTA